MLKRASVPNFVELIGTAFVRTSTNSCSYGQVVLKEIRVFVHASSHGHKKKGAGRMIGRATLWQGPSREQLFDSLRLGTRTRELQTVVFMGKRLVDGASVSDALVVRIEGLHRASSDDRVWFFWGRLKEIGAFEGLGASWELNDIAFAFGMWDTGERKGRIEFSEASFFQNPLSDEVKGFKDFPLKKGDMVHLWKLKSGRLFVNVMRGVTVIVHRDFGEFPPPDQQAFGAVAELVAATSGGGGLHARFVGQLNGTEGKGQTFELVS